MTERYRVLCADPPWQFRDRLPGKGRGAVKHYSVMSLDDICRFEVPELEDDAYLFLWRVASMPFEALKVVTAWGFIPKAEIVWRKIKADGTPRMGMGHYVRNAHETCLIAVRGRAAQYRLSRSIPSIFDAPRGRHSEKPEQFYDLVEALAPGPYCELFARRRRDGWTCLGNEIEPNSEDRKVLKGEGVASPHCLPVEKQKNLFEECA